MLKHIIKHTHQIRHLLSSRYCLLTPLCDMGTDTCGGNKHSNRLSLEKSPYLLQHASNPVDWFPWGQDAFDKAKSEGKPIFLSVGYSTCHWCHIMEKESFENEEISKILNENFVSIKVDREERPDVDQVYMTFIQATTGHGGWPMTIWLTPDCKPIVGGTYFPPENRYGQAGLKSILLNIAEKWKKNRTAVEGQGSYLLNALKEHSSRIVNSDNDGLLAEDVPDKCYEELKQTYDNNKGGFGEAPKFPQSVNLRFLLSVYGKAPSCEQGQTARDMCKHTLMMMRKGGIWDHISKGFHRYSTDSDWHVPHFEKMLYDQAQLVVAYCEAYQVTKEERFATVIRDILEYVNKELSHKSGGFYSAEDADSYPADDSLQKKEGAFYVWKEKDIRTALKEPLPGSNSKTKADVFCYHFNVKPNGNVDLSKDPHGQLLGENVLIEIGDIHDTAEHFGLTDKQVDDILNESRVKLAEIRNLRPRPHLDNKMITAWNGLMISGFAKASQIIGDQAYKERLLKAVEFVHSNLYDPETDVLYRSCYVGDEGGITHISTPIQGFAEDYAYIIQGLLDAYEASFNDSWIEWAERLQQKMNQLFWDEEQGGYFTSRTDDSSVILRIKDSQDGAEPSANSVAASNLIRLSSLNENSKWKEQSRQIFVAFQGRLQSLPHALPEMVRAYVHYHQPGIQIILVGDPDAADSQMLLRSIHSHYLPAKTLISAHHQPGSERYLYQQLPLLSTLTKIDDKATVYVCKQFTCLPPVNNEKDLQRVLTQQTQTGLSE